jgi:hypothetical protein
MTDQPDRRRALAFNAVGPAINQAGYWLPLSARKAVADAILDAIDDPAAGYCPHCGRGDAGPDPEALEPPAGYVDPNPTIPSIDATA